MNEMVKRRKDDGFTLIELMIVIAVIGILAVVLVPKMGNVKTSAKITGVQTNYRSVTTALQAMSDLNPTHTAAVIASDITTELPTDITASMKNPFTQSTGTGAVTVTTTAPTGAAAAGLIIAVPTTTGSVISIDVYGCDETGAKITGLETTITP